MATSQRLGTQRLGTWTILAAKITDRFRIAMVLAFFTLLASGGEGVASALNDVALMDLYTIADVKVDASAKNAVSAREAAMLQGQRAAFAELVKRLSIPGESGAVPDASANDLADVVLGVAVSYEKASRIRYQARISVSFQPEATRALLNKLGVAYVDRLSLPVVVLPLFRPEPSMPVVLWEEPNPWRSAWSVRPSRPGLVPLMVPMGDLEDMAAIDAQQALRRDREALEKIARHYNVSDVLLLLAEPVAAEGDRDPGLNVSVWREDRASEDFSIFVGGSRGAALQETLKKAVTAVERRLEQEWKSASGFDQNAGRMEATMIFDQGVKEWAAIRALLDATPYVRSWTVKVLTRNWAQVEIQYAGSVSQFVEIMERAGLSIFQEDGVWSARLAAPSGSPASSGRNAAGGKS